MKPSRRQKLCVLGQAVGVSEHVATDTQEELPQGPPVSPELRRRRVLVAGGPGSSPSERRVTPAALHGA